MDLPQKTKHSSQKLHPDQLFNICHVHKLLFLLVTLPIYIVQLGGTESEVGLIIGVFTISAVLLRPFIGVGVDVIGRKSILVAGLTDIPFVHAAL